MKKILLICIILFAWCVQAESQKYLNFYQDDIVILKILASDVDSINITETEPYIINLWYEGTVFQSYASEEVDSIIVTDERGEPLSYLGAVGFNSELYTKRVGLLSPSTISKYESFINNLPKKDGTILYYAVDSALNVLEEANIKSQLSSVYFITFTDGLDQGSIMLNPKYNSSNNYLQDVSKRISEAQVEGLSVNAYTIGLRGKDVTDVDMFKRNLNSLATSEDKAFEVRDISELRSRLQEIANKIISINTRQTISVKIPGIDNGTTIRFTFDVDGNDANNSQLYIEGTLNLSDYSLHDVTYHGIKARSGSIVQGTQDGIFLTFTFTGMRREDESGTLNTNYVKHFYRIPSSTAWQVNSEFTPTNNIQRNVSYSGTSIILVLDCSSSLGGDFNKMQSYAKEFINMVAKNTMPYSFDTPRNVQAALDSTNLTIDVSWDAVTYADYYMVYRNNSNSYYSDYTLIADSVASTSWKDERPISGNNYYKVCAVGLGLTSEKSNSSNSVSCSLDAPKNISGELVLNGDSLAIRMKWDAVKYAEYYKIYRSDNYRNGYKLMVDSITDISWIDASPLAGSNYYKVCAVSRGIISSESNFCEVKCMLDVPKNVNAVQDSIMMAIHVTWDEVSFAQRYKVYRSNSNSSYSNYELIADSVVSTSWRDDAPMKGSNYYKVSAVGYGLTSSQSNTSNVVNCSLDAPKNISGELVLNGDSLAIRMKWDAVKYAEHYKIYRSNNYRNGYKLMSDSIVDNSWIDVAPLAGSNYYKICAVNQSVTSSESNYCEVKYALGIPQNINAVQDSVKMAIHVTWDKVDCAQRYKIYRSNSNSSYSNYELIADSVASTSWRDDAPMKGNNYYKVSAVGYGLTSSQSNASNVVNCTLEAPKNVYATLDNSEFVVHVSWDAVKYAKHYQIYRSNNASSNSKLIADSIISTSWTDKSPMAGNNYYWVYAVHNNITSTASNKAQVSCNLDAPTNVTSEMVLNNQNLSIQVKWNASKYAESYKIYRSSVSNRNFNLIADSVPSTLWIDINPNNGSNYYKVSAIGHGMSSSQSNVSNETIYTIDNPKNVKGELVLSGNKLAANLTWDAVNFAETYSIYRCKSSGGTYSMIAEDIKATNWIDNTPLEGNNYYKVIALGYGLKSSLSTASNVVNVALAAPKNVKGELVLSGNKLAANITWDAVLFAQSYNVYRSSSTGSNTFKLVAENVTSTSWIDTTPLEDNNYYRVCAVGYGLTSPVSNTSNLVKIELKAPENVKAELTLKDNSLSVKVTWNTVKLAEFYCVYRCNSSNGTYSLMEESIKDTIWTDKTPLIGNNYYKVIASGYGLKSTMSSASNVVNVALAAPKNVKGELVLSGNKLVANITWDAVNFAETYSIYRCKSSGGTYSMIAEDIKATNWIDNTPLEGNNYYKVIASGYGLKSTMSSASNVVNVALAAPKNVKGELVLSNNNPVANITWDVVQFAQSYKVYRSSSYNGTYTLLTENVLSTTWTDNSPQNGSNYYKVSAYGYGLNSLQSSASNVVTK